MREKSWREQIVRTKNKRKGIRRIGGLLLLGSLAFGGTGHAAEGDPIGFNVKAVTPEKQIDLNKTYFYIKTEPNQSQHLKVNVTNNEDKEITVETTAANAITAPNGKISYVSGAEDKDKTLQNSIEEMVHVEPKELVLKKGETKPVSITIMPPSEHYKGIKLGTLFFQKKGETKPKDGAQVNSEYRYAIDLVTSEDDQPLYGGKKLTLDSAEATLLLREKAIALKFSNADPKVIQDLNLIAQVSEKESNTVLKSAELENGRMAPNSHFTFEIPWGLDTFKAGTYVVKVKATSNTESWEFEKEFNITADQAKQMNKETVTKLTFPLWVYGVFIGSIAVFIGTTVFLQIRQRGWNAQLQKAKRKSQKARKKRKKEREAHE